MNSVYFIPNNYTDAGKLLGAFEIRNVIECAILCVPIVFFTIILSPFGLTGTLILGAILLVPTGGFALTGVYDYSLFTFLRLHRRWRRNRRILTYRGSLWESKKKH